MHSKNIIFTADDFGLSLSVNEAIDRAHREGVLSTASMMMGAPATKDAVRRARELPQLRVGLHVVLVNGHPLSAPETILDLVDRQGAFLTNLTGAGARFYFRAGVRRQLDTEIRAQFEAFRTTGLPLDHVNAQNHMHVHPTVLTSILRIGRDYGMRAVRVPYEPFLPSWRGTHFALCRRLAQSVLLVPLLLLMRARLRSAGMTSNDYVFGMNDTGEMTAQRMLRFLAILPHGICEIYSHPEMANSEYEALIDPNVSRAVEAFGLRRVTFGELSGAARN